MDTHFVVLKLFLISQGHSAPHESKNIPQDADPAWFECGWFNKILQLAALKLSAN